MSRKLIGHHGLVGAVALAVLLGSPAFAAGKGKIKPYDLSLLALMNADDSVDLYVDVGVIEAYQATFGSPALSKHIQLKSFDLEGKLRWTKNYQDEVLTPNAADTSSSVEFVYTDMLYRQPVKAQVQVQNVETTDTEVLRNVAEVLWRPDLVLTAITTPEEVSVDEQFSVTVTVNEENGDLGATADIVLYEGATELMRMPGAAIDPAGPTVVQFEEISLGALGAHTLTAAIENADPGDFDLSNNSADVTITVVDSTTAAAVFLNYSHISTRYMQEWDNYYSKGIQDDTSVGQDNTTIQIRPGKSTIDFPVDLTYTLSVDGAVFATDDLLGLGVTFSGQPFFDSHTSNLAPGQQVQVVDYGPYYNPYYSDYASFQTFTFQHYYSLRKEDTDGDGVLKTIWDYDLNVYGYGDPIAGAELPTSITVAMELTTGATTYAGTVSASAAELVPRGNIFDYSTEYGTRGVDYYKYSRDTRTIQVNNRN